MNSIKHILWVAMAALGAVVVTAGPALAGTRLNHTEPLHRR
jgi:hypothetical protein